jgi:hypothetical protein
MILPSAAMAVDRRGDPSIYHDDTGKYHMKRTYIFLFIILILSILVCGCDNTPASYSYKVAVSGLENYTSNGTTKIFVPAPIINGSTFFY